MVISAEVRIRGMVAHELRIIVEKVSVSRQELVLKRYTLPMAETLIIA